MRSNGWSARATRSRWYLFTRGLGGRGSSGYFSVNVIEREMAVGTTTTSRLGRREVAVGTPTTSRLA